MKTNDKPNTDRLTSLRKGTQMNPQKIARVTGVLFLITYITAIPAVFLYGPGLADPRYILSGGAADKGLALGALLELILIIANIGSAVVLYPVVKRVSEIFALGFVTARVMESVFIAVGALSVLSLVTLRQEAAAAGADAGSLAAVGQSLVAFHDWTFLLGPGFVVGVGNGLILGYLMYRSGLMPRRLAILGLIAGSVLIARFVGILFGVFEPGTVLAGIMVAPEFIWELSLAVWLIVKGFNPAAVASLSTDPDDGVLTGVDQPAVVPTNGHAASNG